MDIFENVFILIMGLYVYGSVIVLIYSIYKKRDLGVKPLFGLIFFNDYFFFIGSIIGLSIFFFSGFDGIFSFISQPNGWSFNPAPALSVFLAIFVVGKLEGLVSNIKK